MTPEERRLVDNLCKRIADEKDPFIFHQLVQQLDEVLARKKQRLQKQERSTPDTRLATAEKSLERPD
jgi:DNA replication initiation complex subunit (GINS family)